MTIDNLDPFAIGGRQENQDGEILTLFREWLDICRVLDANSDYEDGTDEEARYNTAANRQCDIEDRVFECRGGPVGMAIKAFFDIYRDTAAWAPSAAHIRFKDQDRAAWLTSMLRDAAALVPEIAECAAAVLHADAALIDADMDMQWLAECWLDKPRTEWSDLAISKERNALDTIANTAAKTPRGEAIKNKHAKVPA